jgi:hypothetical protein
MRFARDVALFVGLQAALALAVDTVYMKKLGRYHFLASIRDKNARLAAVPSPRILLIGGSSTAFGVNSQAIEHASGRPVVNLAVNAGLGRSFILSQATAAAQPGDLLVLMPEYNLLWPEEAVDTPTLWLTLRFAPRSVRFVPLSVVPKMLDAGFGTLTERLQGLAVVARGESWENPIYSRKAFDQRGDVIAHLAQPAGLAKDEHVGISPASTLGPACRRLAAFGRDVRARGARVVIVPPPIPEDDAALIATEIAAIWDRVEREGGITVLGARKTYSRESFLDTGYHLAAPGRQERTRHLVDLIRRFEAGASASPSP